MVKKMLETVVICLRCFSTFLRHGVGLPGLSNASGLEEVYNVTGSMLFSVTRRKAECSCRVDSFSFIVVMCGIRKHHKHDAVICFIVLYHMFHY